MIHNNDDKSQINMQNKCVLFCRVSSKEQEETGYSLPAQEKFLGEYAEKQGLKVEKTFAISESAAGKVQRKTFIEMVAYVRKNDIPVIVVETTDRLTRNFTDVPTIDLWITESESHQVHLVKEGCVLHNSSRSHEWFMWRVKVATAEYYVRLLSENVKKGQKEKISQGWLPTKPPLGYKTVGDKGHKVHIIDDGKSHLVKRLFEGFASGEYSVTTISNKAYEIGLRTPNGGKVARSRIHGYLRDPFYIGKLRWKDEIYEGKHEPLIDEDIFNKVQSLLTSKNTPKYRKLNHLFKTKIRCGECKGLITWEPHKGTNYGHCNKRYHNCSQNTWVREPDIENQLLKGFEKLEIKSPRLVGWIRKALKESHREEADFHSSSVDELRKRYDQIKFRLDKLYDDKLDETITGAFYRQKYDQYTKELNDIDHSLGKHTQANKKYFELGINIYEISQRAADIYRKAKLEDKRQLISLVYNQMTVKDSVLFYSYTKPFQILAEAVIVTNSSNTDKVINNHTVKFEPEENVDISTKKEGFYALHPILLPRRDSNPEPCR